MEFEKFGAPGDKPEAWLKVRDGAYLRMRDITAVTVGTPAEDGSLTHTDTVFVHLLHGGGAAFDACESRESAVEMADTLILALEANGSGF